MCVQGPQITPPDFSNIGGLSLVPPSLPAFSGDLNLCCKVVPYSVPSIPIPLPSGTFNPGAAAVLRLALASLQAFLDSVPPLCPRE